MNKKQEIYKIIILITIIMFFIYLTKELLPIFINLATEEGRNTFKIAIENLGVKGAASLIGLMCAQILVPILPGEPIEILAGMCFGPVMGLIVVMIGAFISTILIVTLVKIFGKKFIYSFIKKEKIDKIENSKFFKNKKKMEIILFILFFVPGAPKDIFIYIAALLPIDLWKFIAITTVARIPSIISSTIAGSNIFIGDWKMIILAYLITFLIVGIIIFIVNKKDKNILKEVNEIK